MTEQFRRWAPLRTFAVGVLACLAACATTPELYETKRSGSYANSTATTSSKTAACNVQVRIGNWSAFGTGYHTKTVSNTPNESYTHSVIKTRYANIGQFFLGFDPDPATDYRTIDVSKRWGGNQFREATTYIETAHNIPDGTDGFYLRILDGGVTGERRSALDINIYHSGLYQLMKKRGHLERKTDEERISGVSVIYQFEKGAVFPEPRSFLPVFRDNGVLSIRYGDTGGWGESKSEIDHKAELLAYLLIAEQPSSLLNISLIESSGQVLYVAKLDMRDARQVFARAYAAYTGLIDRGCASR